MQIVKTSGIIYEYSSVDVDSSNIERTLTIVVHISHFTMGWGTRKCVKVIYKIKDHRFYKNENTFTLTCLTSASFSIFTGTTVHLYIVIYLLEL